MTFLLYCGAWQELATVSTICEACLELADGAFFFFTQIKSIAKSWRNQPGFVIKYTST